MKPTARVLHTSRGPIVGEVKTEMLICLRRRLRGILKRGIQATELSGLIAVP
jgi:hypothetical protein